MARVEYDEDECRTNFQIENGIRRTLRNHPTAEVATSVIRDEYELRDAIENPLEGCVEQKCQSLGMFLDAAYSIEHENIVFRPATPGKPRQKADSRR